MRDFRLWILILLLVILAAIHIGHHKERERPASENTARLELRCGEAMADLVAKQLTDRQNIVLVAHHAGSSQETGEIEAAFKRRAKKKSLNLIETLYLDTPERLAGEMQVQALNAASLRPALSAQSDIDAIVSLCGEPTGKLAELESLPPFFCLCDQGERIPELMQANIVQAAYVPRRTDLFDKPSNDWFAMLYQLALPETVDAIYADSTE